MEAEAEAVDGRLKEAEAEAKEKFTAVASLLIRITITLFGVGYSGSLMGAAWPEHRVEASGVYVF